MLSLRGTMTQYTNARSRYRTLSFSPQFPIFISSDQHVLFSAPPECTGKTFFRDSAVKSVCVCPSFSSLFWNGLIFFNHRDTHSLSLSPFQVRTLIQRDFSAALESFDALLTPTAPTPAFKKGRKSSSNSGSGSGSGSGSSSGSGSGLCT